MEQRKSKLARALLTVAAFSALAASAQAVVFTEPATDAGQTLATAAAAGTFNNTAAGLTGISGNIGSATDADVYSFTLSVATSLRFAASSTAGIDSSIFLFNSTGVAIIGNDDQSGLSLDGAFTTGLLTAGTYYFGITLSGNEPVNSANQLLFTSDQPTTNIRTAAPNVNPTTLSNFNNGQTDGVTGAYLVNITAVPEPSTTVTALAGILATFGLGRWLRRRAA